jgi:hypothetical protein
MLSPKNRQLGATNWAFVITLILLLVFVWLWFQESDKQEGHAKQIAELTQKTKDLNADGVKLYDIVKSISDVVGWTGQHFQSNVLGGGSLPVLTYSDPALIKANFDPEGMVPGKDGGAPTDGILKRIIAASQLSFSREARLHTTKTGEETEHKYSTLSTAFKQKLKEVIAKWSGISMDCPIPPADPDDTEGQAKYVAERADYEKKVKEYDKALEDLSNMEGWKEYKVRLAAPGQWNDPEQIGVTVHFYQYTDPGEGLRTIEAAMVGMDEAFRRMGAELKANMDTWSAELVQLRKNNKAKDDAIKDLQDKLAKEQQAHTSDTEKLQDQITQSQERANRNAVAKTAAESELAKVKDESSKSVASLKREVEARKEQNRLLKEKRDLVVARDDPDGSVLVADNSLGTAMIDLGFKDKVYVGQKFVVSALDRGGNRVNKGEIMIIRVTGDHSAKTRILSGAAGQGDRIHNPFYQRGEKIYVYIAGKLDKWPKAMAAERLAKMNVVVQDAPNGKTHYIIVPDSWTLPAPKAEEGAQPAAGASAETPLEKAMKTARIFGANVITEKLLDAFLDY